jgi:hypothetical protein
VKPAGGLEALNDVGAAGASVEMIESDEEGTEPELLAAMTMKVEVPPAVGVPERTPVEDRVSPAGSEPEVTV